MQNIYRDTNVGEENKDFIKVFFVSVISIVVLTNGYEWNIGSINLTPERIASLIIFYVTLIFILVNYGVYRMRKDAFLLSLWLFTALISSLFSPVSQLAIKGWIVMAVVTSYYYLVLVANFNPIRFLKSKLFILFAWFLGPALTVIYLISLISHNYDQIIWVKWLSQSGGGIRLKGTTLEPNIFASVISVFTIIVVSLKQRMQKYRWWVLIIGLHLSLMLSFSRGPWIAYFVGIIAYKLAILDKKYTRKNIIKVSLYIFVTLTLLLILALWIFHNYGDIKILARTQTLSVRFIIWGLAVEDVISRPFFGNGIFSFSGLVPYAPSMVESESIRSAWISNLFLIVLHDTGIVGFLVFILFISTVLVQGWKKLRIARELKCFERADIKIAGAIFGGNIALLLSGQTIPLISLSFYWVVLAFMSQVKIYQRKLISK